MSRSVSTSLVRAWRRLVFRWHRAQLYRELAEELEFHRILKARENERAGLAPETAVELSRKQMGNMKLAKEDSRDVSGSIPDCRSTIRVFISFAATAILLAAIGIYGLVSYWVTQRTYGIGLRVAIGATRQRIMSMILAQSLRVALYGIGTGLIAALALTHFLASLLYGVAATDPITLTAVTALLLGVAATATALPAWRAARIDPVKSLRVD